MTRRSWDRYGMRVQSGRSLTRPFGRIPDWPQRVQDLAAMGAAESAANQRRVEMRQAERLAPCNGCGQPGPGHAPGCIWRGRTG